MKRAAFVLWLFVAACAPLPPSAPFREATAETCVPIRVENRGWPDIVIHVDGVRRLGDVTGMTTKDFQLCEYAGLRTRFAVHAIGNAFDITLSSNLQYFEPAHPIKLVIGVTPRQSFVIGS